MEEQNVSYTSSAWPMRVSGVSIFLIVLGIYFFSQNVPVYVPLITFGFALVSVLFSSAVSVTTNKALRTLTISKKRLLGSTTKVYAYDDIVYICRNVTVVTDAKGMTSENISFSLALKGHTGALYERGFVPFPFTIPVSGITSFSKVMREAEEIVKARELSRAIGIMFYENGTPNDTLINAAEDISMYAKDLPKIAEALSQAKEENDRAAREILQSE